MKPQKITLLITLLATITLSTFCGTTLAITGNSQPDTTRYTCIIVQYSDAERTQPISYSTGVLISPNIVLTAGHCVVGGQAVSVCFDQNPTVTVTQTGLSYSTDQPIYNGVGVAYPQYILSLLAGAKPSEALQTSDVGLIILDQPVTEVTSYPSLPEGGLADNLSTGTKLQVIGYGVQEQITPRNSDKTWVGTFTLNTATVKLLSNNFQGSNNYIKCSANQAQGKGGIAYGDSGGPAIYSNNGENVVLAINAYVNNANCAGVTFHTRIDNPQVLNWISGYM
ncbi:MAG TPA: trypsin-like serine protease [Candidatus Acidoferrales bacterium]|nr:trypsin-like serine protease [Candidatus Acidoferrales bacterium]